MLPNAPQIVPCNKFFKDNFGEIMRLVSVTKNATNDTQSYCFGLLISAQELKYLHLMLKASLLLDRFIKDISIEEAAALSDKIAALIVACTGDDIKFSVKWRDLEKVGMIVAFIRTMDPESYFSELRKEFPGSEEIEIVVTMLNELVDQVRDLLKREEEDRKITELIDIHHRTIDELAKR